MVTALNAPTLAELQTRDASRTLGELLPHLEACIAAKRPAFLSGPPGVGKTAFGDYLAERLGGRTLLWSLPNMDPSELGLPDIDRRGPEPITTWTRPDLFPQDGKGVLLIDEVTRAPDLMQAATYSVIAERRLRQRYLGDGWAVIGCGNRPEDGRGVRPLEASLRSRFAFFEVKVGFDDWRKWAIQPKVNIHPAVLGYLTWRPTALHPFSLDPDAAKNYGTFRDIKGSFPCPRTWHYLSDLLQQWTPDDFDDQMCMAEANLGRAAAGEFVAFLGLYTRLPSMDAIITSPASAPLVEGADVCFAVTSGLALRANPANFERCLQYMARLSEEFQTLFIKTAIESTPALTIEPAYTRWSAAHPDLI